jgi:hypothetical protein
MQQAAHFRAISGREFFDGGFDFIMVVIRPSMSVSSVHFKKNRRKMA